MTEDDRGAVVFVGLGSNLGDRQENLRQAVMEIREVMPVERISSIWLTEPVGFREQPAFYNAALAGRSNLPPRPLLDALLGIERRMGRRRDQGAVTMGPRTIDLDLLVYGGLAIDQPGLVLPHPRMAGRRFVLAPLAEIAPDLRLGLNSPPVSELLQRLGSHGAVERLHLEGWPPPSG